MADATSAWNANCDTWQFPKAPQSDNRATFGTAWDVQPHTGLDFPTAIAGITADVNSALGTTVIPPGLDDLFNARIQNWQ
jgi:hypothetical protein